MSKNENELKVVNVRLVKEPSMYSEKPIERPSDAAEVIGKELSQFDREVFCILNLQSGGQVINMNIVSVGTLNATIVSPREVFKTSILSNAAGIIAIHNHPSGRVTPSREDIETTKRLQECGELLDIQLIDHIIVGGESSQFLSMKAEGYMDQRTRMRDKEWER